MILLEMKENGIIQNIWVKTQKIEKQGDKNRNNEQGQQIENNNKYGRY